MLVALLSGIAMLPSIANADQWDIWIGTSSGNNSRGIYHCLLDGDSGKLGPSELVAEIRAPGFLELHPEHHLLYAVGQLQDGPCVAVYRVLGLGDQARLELVDQESTGDGGGTHVSVHPSGRLLLTAQYGGGSVSAYALEKSGLISRRTQVIEHQGGSGVVPGRQDAPHPHWTGFSPDGRFALVPDLGLDEVIIYRVDLETQTIHPHGAAPTGPGSGPRHLKFHPNGKWVYVLNELALSVAVFQYDVDSGSMELKQTIPTVPAEELAREKFASASEIRVHPTGRFVYTANRGHDTITVFSVSSAGTLSPVQVEPVRGATPRNFNLSPDGAWLVVGGQDSNTLASFEVDPQSGRITYNRSIITTPSPICILFHPH
ncbi:MAG: lactonase family protein [Planctomycetota bacterium]|nr:MAG: lactonase family protein [Planctomycetota bacterium]